MEKLECFFRVDGETMHEVTPEIMKAVIEAFASKASSVPVRPTTTAQRASMGKAVNKPEKGESIADYIKRAASTFGTENFPLEDLVAKMFECGWKTESADERSREGMIRTKLRNMTNVIRKNADSTYTNVEKGEE